MSIRLNDEQRATAHMAASLLLDYPSASAREQWQEIASAVAALPSAVRESFDAFWTGCAPFTDQELEKHYVAIFDQKRRCCLYLSYYAAGDTRRRGMALVTFIEAYRAGGFEVSGDELPDYLPVALEFSARGDREVAAALLGAHRDGLEVLRAALHATSTPYAHLLDAVCATLGEIDSATRERVVDLIGAGPPAEMVGLTFLGNLPPFSPRGDEHQEISA